jgi:hypothetical protein
MKTLNDLIEEAKGEMVLAVGRGTFHATLDAFLRSAHSLGYNLATKQVIEKKNKKYVEFSRKKK